MPSRIGWWVVALLALPALAVGRADRVSPGGGAGRRAGPPRHRAGRGSRRLPVDRHPGRPGALRRRRRSGFSRRARTTPAWAAATCAASCRRATAGLGRHLRRRAFAFRSGRRDLPPLPPRPGGSAKPPERPGRRPGRGRRRLRLGGDRRRARPARSAHRATSRISATTRRIRRAWPTTGSARLLVDRAGDLVGGHPRRPPALARRRRLRAGRLRPRRAGLAGRPDRRQAFRGFGRAGCGSAPPSTAPPCSCRAARPANACAAAAAAAGSTPAGSAISGSTASPKLAPDELWIATFGGGIDVVDPRAPHGRRAAARRPQLARRDFGRPGGRPAARARAGLVWVGTWGQGLLLHDPACARLPRPALRAPTCPARL